MSDDDSLDSDNVNEKRFENHLPEVHNSEMGAVRQLRETLNALDGAMSMSNALIPMEAVDVGDTDMNPNPRPHELGHAEGYCVVEEEHGRIIFGDGPNAVLSGERHINAAEGDVISDITNWA